MEQKNNIKFSSVAGAIFTVFVLLSVFLAGCLSQDNGASARQVMPAQGEIEKNMDISAAGNKSSYDKMQEEIQLAVADGTYMKNVSYDYHNGTETMEVMLEVKDDLITSASIKGVGVMHPYSAKLISAVNEQLPSLAVGKKIDELDIPKNVAGSSLTTAAFKGYVQEVIDTY
ncbi:hypothetical protein COU37_05545 [Candidatus Micrarchaeota archaeon CG10_big_fil_rev_8_21_14_0_10_45_29]|nr:MAG: hypothetical protein COU37_05545 [Candidatus Micrarchaeota archaeon CG10_big_fil_rev_8_21_14_0_10_45_29]